MAHGRPDYWRGVLMGFPTPGGGQTDILESDSGAVAADSNSNFISYTVPADYILYITFMMVTCNYPVLQRARVSIDGSYVDDVYYYLTKQWLLNPSGLYVATEGEVVLVTVYNLDEVSRNFAVTMAGFLETG